MSCLLIFMLVALVALLYRYIYMVRLAKILEHLPYFLEEDITTTRFVACIVVYMEACFFVFFLSLSCAVEDTRMSLYNEIE